MEYLRFILSFIITKIILIIRFGNRSNFKNILIIRLDHLGDVVCSLKAIKNLRENYKEANITLLTGKWNTPLFINHSEINQVIEYNSPLFSRNKHQAFDLHDRIQLAKKMLSERYDLVVGLRDDFYTIFLSLLILPKRRVDRGSERIKMKLQLIINRFIKNKDSIPQHEIDTNKIVILPLIKIYSENQIHFKFSEDEIKWLNDFLVNFHLVKNCYAILHPGASWQYKRWDYNNFAIVGEYLFNKYNLSSIIIGSPDEKMIGEKISENRGKIFINMVGEISLRNSILLIANSGITICNDSSPMHISAQLGIPTIGLMGPGDVDKFGPRGKHVACLHKKVDCYPCDQITCKFPQNPCVNLNRPNEVFHAIDTFFQYKF